MSTDTATLLALEKQTQAELRYFELVVLKSVGESHTCFCGVGKHGIYFLRRNLSGLYPSKEGGELLFAHILKLTKDKDGPTDLWLTMSPNRPSDWASENIFIVSETRSTLVNQIIIAWQTSYTWRFGAVKALPCEEKSFRKTRQAGLLQVMPWNGWWRLEVNGYYIFIPNGYETNEGNMQAGTGTICRDKATGKEIHIHVQPPVSLIDLEVLGHEHIRWVAMEYKQHIAEQQQPAVVIQNGFYFKKMNIANDLASWSAWELYIKSESFAIAAVLLRRQHTPPLLDTAADMSVMLKCPMSVLNEGKLKDEDLLREARVAADSMHPVIKNCTAYPSVYRDMIQAKLDALLFNEDSIKWIDSMLGLKPACEPDARKFIKSILKMLQDENALNMPDLLGKVDLPNQVISAVHDPMQIPEDLKNSVKNAETNLSDQRFGADAVNAWDARLARYLTSMLDGGLLGPDFTLLDVTSAFLITPVSRKSQLDIILYLLHIRPTNMEEPRQPGTSISNLLNSKHFNDYTFNDRAMQALLELKWVEQQLSDPTRDEKKMSKDYAKFLALLLVSKSVSTSLKAAICRQIIADTQKEPYYSILVPALMDTMVQGNLHLTTYCTVTLVNLSRGQELVKNMLVSRGIAPICAEQLKCTDDDLIQYTLVLLTNISKSMHHRERINRCGIVVVLEELLINSYAKPDKKKVLTELASVIGQLCNDEATRKILAGPDTSTINCFLETFKRAESNVKLKSKVMFALKQLSVNCSEETRVRVGKKVIDTLIDDLAIESSKKGEEAMDMDFAMNGLLLLLLLSLSQENCKKMASHKPMSYSGLLNKLKLSKMWTLEAAREKLIQLDTRVVSASKYVAE